jgi:hypothetical protein
MGEDQQLKEEIFYENYKDFVFPEFSISISIS